MKFLELIHTLQESAKIRYMAMANGAPEIPLDWSSRITFKQQLELLIKSFMRAEFDRSDIIIWLIKVARGYLVERTLHDYLVTSQYHEGGDDGQAKLQAQEALKILGEYKKKISPYPRTRVPQDSLNVILRDLLHFLSLPIPEIQNFRFTNQNVGDVFKFFQDAEKKWKDERKGVLEQDDETEELIRFPDGSGWFNLNRAVCDAEADAMGHCGNAGNPYDTDTILSYRTPKRVGQKVMWEPHLTFILDTRDGMLGEMKGKGNDKPAPKYHRVIVELLKNPLIKGIRGGGYLPEHNFKMSDLPEDVRKKLVAEKPELGSLLDMVETGLAPNDPKIMEKIVSALEVDKNKFAWSDQEQAYIEYPSKSLPTTELFNDIFGAGTTYGRRRREPVCVTVAKYLTWDEHFEVYSDSVSRVDIQEFLEACVKKKPEFLSALQKYTADTYGLGVGDRAEDLDLRDISTEINAAEDELYDAIRVSVDRGSEVGAENDMYEDFDNWLKRMKNSGYCWFVFPPEHGWDRANVAVSLKFMSMLVESPGEFTDSSSDPMMTAKEHYERESGVSDMAEPHYGWQGYDEDAAVEYFFDIRLSENVPELANEIH